MPPRRKISLGFISDTFDEGHHIIYVYNDDFERRRTMARFLEQGLLDHEKVLYLVSDISPGEMRGELLALGVNIDEKQNDFDLVGPHHTVCPGHCFSSEFMLDIIADYYDKAISEGYAGARGAGEMSWALAEGRATMPDLLEYEAKLNNVLSSHPLTAICQYDARRFDGTLIMDMLSVHPMMIVRGQLVKNPYYISPEVFLKKYRQRHQRELAGSCRRQGENSTA